MDDTSGIADDPLPYFFGGESGDLEGSPSRLDESFADKVVDRSGWIKSSDPKARRAKRDFVKGCLRCK